MAVTESYIQLPNEGTNDGKQVRTHSRVVNGITVHNHTQELQDPIDDVQARVLTRSVTGGDAGLVVCSQSDLFTAQQLALMQQEHAIQYEERLGFRPGPAAGPRFGFRS